METLAHFCVVQIWLAVITLAYGVEVVVHPSSRTVAPNSYANFKCVIIGGTSAYIMWKVNGFEFGEHGDEPTGVDATWHSHLNASLNISTQDGNGNGTIIQCKAVDVKIQGGFTPKAILRVAGPPLEPEGLIVNFNHSRATVDLRWNAPFTFMPQFPILNYMANVDYFRSETHTKSIYINATETKWSISLNETEICTCKRICISLKARNLIGESPETGKSCVDIVREHQPFPVNTTLSKQSDGKTLVTVIFQVASTIGFPLRYVYVRDGSSILTPQMPQCFPQGMQPRVVVEEAPAEVRDDFTTSPPLEWGDKLTEGFGMAMMKQDVMYSVTVYLSSESENTSSIPAFVSLPAKGIIEPENGDDGGGQDTGVIIIAVITGVLLLAILIIAGLATSVAVYISIDRKRKASSLSSNPMQTNPFYENTVYDSIPESFALPPPPSYESHIYQDLPELARRVPAENESFPVETHPTPYTAVDVCVEEEQEDEGKNEADNGGRESDYIVMQSVTEPPSPLQTESIC